MHLGACIHVEGKLFLGLRNETTKGLLAMSGSRPVRKDAFLECPPDCERDCDLVGDTLRGKERAEYLRAGTRDRLPTARYLDSVS